MLAAARFLLLSTHLVAKLLLHCGLFILPTRANRLIRVLFHFGAIASAFLLDL